MHASANLVIVTEILLVRLPADPWMQELPRAPSSGEVLQFDRTRAVQNINPGQILRRC